MADNDKERELFEDACEYFGIPKTSIAARQVWDEARSQHASGEPVAWMTDDGRVATDTTKQCMPKSSRVNFNIPLGVIATLQPAAEKPKQSTWADIAPNHPAEKPGQIATPEMLAEREAASAERVKELAKKQVDSEFAAEKESQGDLLAALQDIAYTRPPGPITKAKEWVETHERRALQAIQAAKSTQPAAQSAVGAADCHPTCGYIGADCDYPACKAAAAQAQPVAVPEGDAAQALDLLEKLYSAYEDGPSCYEDPDETAGYLGNAIRLDEATETACIALLNKHRPRVVEIAAAIRALAAQPAQQAAQNNKEPNNG